MKSFSRICIRAVAAAVAAALLLLALNVVLLVVTAVQFQQGQPLQRAAASKVSAGLAAHADQYALTDSAAETLHAQYQWAMLIDPAGAVCWSTDLPDDVPLQYSLNEVASLSRWYLRDYPVHIWTRDDGLLVLGSAKHSLWKHQLVSSNDNIGSLPMRLGALLACNIAAVLGLTLLIGFVLWRAFRPLVEGIERLPDGEPLALSQTGVTRDLAASINRAADALHRQSVALHTRDRARANWIAGVSHDIRTPLATVMGYAAAMEDDPALPPDTRDQAAVMRRQTERIRLLVQDLNLTARLEYDMQPLRPAVLHPAALLRKVCADTLNNRLAGPCTLEVYIVAAAERCTLSADALLLERALGNLIQNSIHCNPQGCTIRLSLSVEPALCRLIVSDNGVGLDTQALADLRARLAPDAPPDTATGHGLGLRITAQIARAHDGTLTLTGGPGRGLRAELTLPTEP